MKCANCGAAVAVQLAHLIVGPHKFCSNPCRNVFIPAEYMRLRDAVLRALPHERSNRAREMLVAALKGELGKAG